MAGKYLVGVIKGLALGDEVAILFPATVPHHLIERLLFENGPVSGGFYSAADELNAAQCWGKSVSCKVASRPTDIRLIEMTLDVNGIFGG